jgi:hypothetical protein
LTLRRSSRGKNRLFNGAEELLLRRYFLRGGLFLVWYFFRGFMRINRFSQITT